jgi:hypothetical protein
MATKKPMYGYTIADDVDPNLPDQSGGKFDTEKMLRGQAQLVQTPFADRKAMRYLGTGDEPDFDVTKAGAGRGKQGGPTAKELADYERKQNAGIFTEGKKMPPSPREMKKGGMTASKRGDGIATKGKTRGTMITMKGGGYAC